MATRVVAMARGRREGRGRFLPSFPMSKFVYRLALASLCSAAVATAALDVAETADTIAVTRDDAPVLTYHKAVVPPPDGVDAAFNRSGFIHPLHTPKGGVVTSIHAEDHYHHLGLWHAWVHSEFRGRELDFWNLLKRQGTVRFAGPVALEHGADAVGFTVRQQQVALATAERPEEVVLEELFTVRVHDTDAAQVIDYEIVQQNVTDAPLEFPAYRYGGGIAYRAPLSWGEANDAYVTSTGLDRTNSHETRADWCAMHGPTETGEATVVIMNHPSNHDSPQRMRVWPKGHVFFNYVPAQENSWSIAPGESITLRYRVVVRDGDFDRATAESDWSDYAATR